MRLKVEITKKLLGGIYHSTLKKCGEPVGVPTLPPINDIGPCNSSATTTSLLSSLFRADILLATSETPALLRQPSTLNNTSTRGNPRHPTPLAGSRITEPLTGGWGSLLRFAWPAALHPTIQVNRLHNHPSVRDRAKICPCLSIQYYPPVSVNRFVNKSLRKF